MPDEILIQLFFYGRWTTLGYADVFTARNEVQMLKNNHPEERFRFLMVWYPKPVKNPAEGYENKS